MAFLLWFTVLCGTAPAYALAGASAEITYPEFKVTLSNYCVQNRARRRTKPAHRCHKSTVYAKRALGIGIGNGAGTGWPTPRRLPTNPRGTLVSDELHPPANPGSGVRGTRGVCAHLDHRAKPRRRPGTLRDGDRGRGSRM